jgi:Zn-dependent protease with chaperone function
MKRTFLPIMATIIGILAPATTWCMADKLKTGISVLGTVLGFFPTIGYITPRVKDLHTAVQNPSESFPNTQPLCPEEEAFYRPYVNSTRELRKEKDATATKNNAFSSGNLIVVPNEISYKGATTTWNKALVLNDTEALKAFAGITEHEEAHSKYRHAPLKAAADIIAPIITTGVAGHYFKKTMPKRRSLKHYVVRNGTKVIGGIGILVVYENIIKPVAGGFLGRACERIADKNVSPEHTDAYAEFLQVTEKEMFENSIKREYPHLSEEDLQKSLEATKRDYFKRWDLTHPSAEERTKRLQSNTKKA